MQSHEIFRRLLKICDLTAEQAAEVTGRSVATIKSYATGRRGIPIDVWAKLREYYKNDEELKKIVEKLEKIVDENDP